MSELWRQASHALGVPQEAESGVPSAGAENGGVTETRRLEQPPGTLIGTHMPALCRRVLEFEDREFVVLSATAGAFMAKRGAVAFAAIGEALPVATVLLGAAAGLARSRTGPLVLLDVEYPYHGLCTLLELEGAPGLSELLLSRAGPAETICLSQEAGLAFLGPGRAALSVWDLAGERMREVFRMLADVFGRILVLAPPPGEGTLETIAAVSEAAAVPSGLVAVHPALTPIAEVQQAINALPPNLPVLGRVIV